MMTSIVPDLRTVCEAFFPGCAAVGEYVATARKVYRVVETTISPDAGMRGLLVIVLTFTVSALLALHSRAQEGVRRWYASAMYLAIHALMVTIVGLAWIFSLLFRTGNSKISVAAALGAGLVLGWGEQTCSEGDGTQQAFSTWWTGTTSVPGSTFTYGIALGLLAGISITLVFV
jgi:hypothetical protein